MTVSILETVRVTVITPGTVHVFYSLLNVSNLSLTVLCDIYRHTESAGRFTSDLENNLTTIPELQLSKKTTTSVTSQQAFFPS